MVKKIIHSEKKNSDFDLPLEDNTNDKTYLNALKNHLPRLVDLFNQFHVLFGRCRCFKD